MFWQLLLRSVTKFKRVNGINVQVIRQLFMAATESTPKLAV
jgi:hypothetical protein